MLPEVSICFVRYEVFQNATAESLVKAVRTRIGIESLESIPEVLHIKPDGENKIVFVFVNGHITRRRAEIEWEADRTGGLIVKENEVEMRHVA